MKFRTNGNLVMGPGEIKFRTKGNLVMGPGRLSSEQREILL